jgi:hypothetical protein
MSRIPWAEIAMVATPVLVGALLFGALGLASWLDHSANSACRDACAPQQWTRELGGCHCQTSRTTWTLATEEAP